MHGNAPFISETLNSISKIELVDFEAHIVLDSASEVVQKKVEYFKSQQDRVVILDSRQPAIVSALNLGI